MEEQGKKLSPELFVNPLSLSGAVLAVIAAIAITVGGGEGRRGRRYVATAVAVMCAVFCAINTGAALAASEAVDGRAVAVLTAYVLLALACVVVIVVNYGRGTASMRAKRGRRGMSRYNVSHTAPIG